MFSTLLRIVPLGIGAALTPSLLGLQILTTSGNPWRARALAVILGTGSAFAIACTALLLGFAQGHVRREGEDTLAGVVWVLAGLALAVTAVWLFSPHPHLEERVEDSIKRRMTDARTRTFFTLAFVLSIKDVSSFVLLVPAMNDIASSGEPFIISVAMALILYALALSPVLGPPLLRLVMRERAADAMAGIYRYVMDHQLKIAGTVSAVFAIYCIAAGLGPGGLNVFS